MKPDGTERMNTHGESRWVFEVTDSLVDRWFQETLISLNEEGLLDARSLNRLKQAAGLLGDGAADADVTMIAGAHVAHRIPLERLLGALTQRRLQAICDVWGWDPSGSKRALVDRTLAQLRWAGYKHALNEGDETDDKVVVGSGTLSTGTNLRARVHVDTIERIDPNEEDVEGPPGYAITLSLALPEHIAQRVFQDYVANGTAHIEFRPLAKRPTADYVRA